MVMREAGWPSFSTSSRPWPTVRVSRSSGVTGGGGGGGGGATTTSTGGGGLGGSTRFTVSPGSGGGGGTESVTAARATGTLAATFGAGLNGAAPPTGNPVPTTPGLTESRGATGFVAAGFGAGDAAAAVVRWSTLSRMLVTPSLTFFPAAPPATLPVAAAPTSDRVWHIAPDTTATINKINRIGHLRSDHNKVFLGDPTGPL